MRGRSRKFETSHDEDPTLRRLRTASGSRLRAVRGLPPALKSFLVADAALREPSALLAVLHVALDAIGEPAFVVGKDGELLQASASARALFERGSTDILGALVDAAAGRPSRPPLTLTPIDVATGRFGFLVTLHRTPDETRIAQAVALATQRWKLTARQVEVLDLVGRGLTNATIAEMLSIRKTTVEFHLCALFDKAGVDNRATLIARLLEL